MAFVAVPNAAKCVVQFAGWQGPFSNTMWFTQALFGTDEQEALAALVDGAFAGDLLPLLNTGVAYVRTLCYDMRSADGPIVTANASAGSGSASSSDQLPGGTAMCITLRTANRGRAGRGRLYIEGFGESQWLEGHFVAGLTASVVTVLQGLHVATRAVSWEPVIVSRQLNGVARVPPVSQPITLVEARNNIDAHQRLRAHRP